MACYGYHVLVPDAWHHGERDPIRHDDPGQLKEHLWPIIIRNVEESSALIQALRGDDGVDSDRIGVMGSSMGGFSAAGALIANPEVKCLICFNGSCAWKAADAIFRKQDGHIPAGAEEAARLSVWDPMAHRELLGLRPILLLHGDRDSQVSIESQREFARVVAPLYQQHPERLQLVEMPRMDHYISTGMFEIAIDWLQKYL